MVDRVSSNQEMDALSATIAALVNRAIEKRVGRYFTQEGTLNLRGNPVNGPLGTEGGGTGTSTGLRDHSHSGAAAQAQQLAEANTHLLLDTAATTRKHWTREDLQDMIATGFLLAGTGVTLVYDDVLNTLTINASAGGGTVYWDSAPVVFDGDGITYG